jgi:hypothetical protein
VAVLRGARQIAWYAGRVDAMTLARTGAARIESSDWRQKPTWTSARTGRQSWCRAMIGSIRLARQAEDGCGQGDEQHCAGYHKRVGILRFKLIEECAHESSEESSSN